MIITIDGPAGAGKSTAAKTLAKRLGFEYLDTGAMYRAVTLACFRAGIGEGSHVLLTNLLSGLRLEMPPGRVLLNGEDVTTLIRTPPITASASLVAVIPAVRRRLVELQRSIAANRNMVCEGRDQGTVVFPEAGCKFFLTADPEERARRRHKELHRRGEKVELKDVLLAQEERDKRDVSRSIGPLVPAADAIILDSTQMSVDEVVATMEQEVKKRTSDEG